MDRVTTNNLNHQNGIAHTEHLFDRFFYNIYGHLTHGDTFPQEIRKLKKWGCLFVDTIHHTLLLYDVEENEKHSFVIPTKDGTHDVVLESLKDCLLELQKEGIGSEKDVLIYRHPFQSEVPGLNVGLLVININPLPFTLDEKVHSVFNKFLGVHHLNFRVFRLSDLYRLLKKDPDSFHTMTKRMILTYEDDINKTKQWIPWQLDWLWPGKFTLPHLNRHSGGNHSKEYV
jgi:hypothetical protein